MFKPGDLVIVVNPCPHCGSTQGMGWIRTVLSHPHVGTSWMDCCDTETSDLEVKTGEDEFHSVCDLRLIPPLSDLETTEREVEHAA